MKMKLFVPDDLLSGKPFDEQFEIVYNKELDYDLETFKRCDALLLTGGADIHPSYYGQQPNAFVTWLNKKRDELEWALIQEALKESKPIIGVCRGAQWLAIAAGGKLYQHVDKHSNGYHAVHLENAYQKLKTVLTNSAHHQLCDLSGIEHDLLAWSKKQATVFFGEKCDINLCPNGLEKEPEMFFIPSIRGFGIQGHPEWLDDGVPYMGYMRQQLSNYFGV